MNAFWLLVLLLAACVLMTCRAADSTEAAAAAAAEDSGEGTAEKKTVEKKVSTKPKKGKKRTTKDWSKVKMEDIEKMWEKGDEEEELEHEYEHSQRIARSKRGGGASSFPKFDINDPESVKRAMKKDPMTFSGLGNTGTSASMAFVELTDRKPDGTEWDKNAIDKLCGRWSALLKTAHLHANTFNLGETEKEGSPRQVLVSIDKGWQAAEIFKFIMMQPETVKITKDSKDYLATEYRKKLEDGEEDEL